VKYQHRVLGMLSLLSVITYLDRVCIAVAGPRMQDALHISPEAWGWVTSVFFLSYSAFEIPTGALGDRIGPRRVLTRIVAWWSAFTALTGAVSSYYVLLLVRFCFGAGEAGAYPNAAAVIARWIPVAKRTRAMGSIDDGSGRRRLLAPARRTNSKSLWLARAFLRVWPCGSGLEPVLVRMVSRFAT
jgi:ACS family glucarate transporter-like MFS transporter